MMKRYDLVTNYRAGSSIEEMEPSDDGEWMRYEDHAAAVAGYEQRMRLIQWWSSQGPGATTDAIAVDPVPERGTNGLRATKPLSSPTVPAPGAVPPPVEPPPQEPELSKLKWLLTFDEFSAREKIWRLIETGVLDLNTDRQLVAKATPPAPQDERGRALEDVHQRMMVFATTKPSPQQTRQKSAREMVEVFAYELNAALRLPPEGE